MALARGIAEKHADLTILDPSGRPAVLARDADRMGALLHEARLVQHQNAAGIAEPLHDIVAADVACPLGIPEAAPEHRLHPPWGFIARIFGQLPAVLALDAADQSI